MTGRSPDGSGSRASHEAAKASSPKASIPNADRLFTVGFTGTQRGWTDKQANAATQVLCEMSRIGAVWMHNGDCVGSDRNAALRWKMGGGKIHLHPPIGQSKRAFIDADEYECPKPYLDRNSEIARRCDALVATPGKMHEELRSGTWSTIRRARKLGKPICIIWPDGSRTHEPLTAQGIEAQRAETTEIGSVADESPVPQGCAQTQSPSTPDNKDKQDG